VSDVVKGDRGRAVFDRQAIPEGGARIFFVRHGEVHNPGGIFYGRLPRFRLSATGERQAESAAAVLAAEPLAAIFTSPLLRARQTGQIIAREHPTAPVGVSRAIVEIRSSLQGSLTATLDTTDWNFYEPLPHDDDETIAMIAARIARFCQLVVRRYPGQTVAAVTHGDILAVARASFEGWPLVLASLRGEVYPATASILSVTLGPNLTAADVAYLKPWEPD
jgi:broad specificity phosphatase PhoE